MNNPNYESSISLDLLRQRDWKAFGALYDRYAPLLYGVILDFLQDEEKTVSILQHVFERAIQDIDDFNPAVLGMFAWLLQSARRASLTFVDNNSVIHLNRQEKYLGNGLRGWVARMPEMERRMMEMFYYNDYPLQKAAQLLKLPEREVEKLRLKTFAGLINVMSPT